MTAPQQIPSFTLSCAKVRGKQTNTRYPDDRRIYTLDDLLEAVTLDHVPGAFADHIRGKDRWRCTECIVLDVDNDPGGPLVTPETIKQDFPDVAHYIVFSRHHNQPKNGKPTAPRFHVYFPTGLLTDAAEVKKLLDTLTTVYNYFDPNCKDIDRFYFGVANPQGEAVPGTLTVDQFMERQSAAPAALPATKGKEIPAGERNATLSAYAFTVLKKFGPEGIAEAEAAFLQRAEDCDPPLSDGELSTIWRYAVQNAPAKIWNKPGYLTPAEYNARDFFSRRSAVLQAF